MKPVARKHNSFMTNKYTPPTQKFRKTTINLWLEGRVAAINA